MRLLIVEDETSLSRVLTALLTKSGYSVDAVLNGKDALEYLENGNYDGMILDVMLPGVDGFEVLRRTRAAGNPIPILMLTAKSEVDDKVAGLDGGANDYLTKPFATKELLARIRAMTRNDPCAADPVLSVGNLRLNRAAKELSSPSGSFYLTNKEFQMMEYLMRNPKSRISTEQFLEKIWGYDSKAEINVVWVYISYLRKKLKSLHTNVCIQAARNTGYYLEVLE